MKMNIPPIRTYGTETSQINDLMQHLKILEKEEQAKLQTSRRVIIKIRTKINEIETQKTHKKNQ
jgi:hypothetical protein